MTAMIDKGTALQSARARKVLGLLVAVVAAVTALVAFLAHASELKSTRAIVDGHTRQLSRHDQALEDIHEDFHWLRDQVTELSRALNVMVIPPPNHPARAEGDER